MHSFVLCVQSLSVERQRINEELRLARQEAEQEIRRARQDAEQIQARMKQQQADIAKQVEVVTKVRPRVLFLLIS